MRAFIDHKPWSDDYEIRLGDDHGAVISYAVRVNADGHIEWEQTADLGAEPPVVLVLRREALEAIMQAAGAFIPEAAATVESLHDTRKVRDRLLTLVERLAT